MNSNDTKLYGVRGWLLFFCLLLTVFEPLIVLIQLFGQMQDPSALQNTDPQAFKYSVILGVLGIALAVFSMYAGLSLWRIAPDAVRVTRYYLVAYAAFSFAPLVFPDFPGVSDGSQNGVISFYLLNALMATAYASAWYAYLARSRRVRNTYFSEPGENAK